MLGKIKLGVNKYGPVYIDLDLLLPGRLLIQANSGGGKSRTIRRIAEQAFKHVQVIIIDPEGEFSTLREKFGFVLVGKGGDTPADVRSAELLAEKLLELRASAICDIFEMKPSDRHKWVRLFLDALLNAPKKYWHPVLIIVDEADRFAPEKSAGESEAKDAMAGMSSRGRKRGFCIIAATQRLSKLDKNFSAELLNRLIGPTFEDIDVERACKTLSIPKAKERVFTAKMRILPPGRFFALGRAISTVRTLVKVGPVMTTHPEVGTTYRSEPTPTPARVKKLLPKLADLPKEAVEQKETLTTLHARVRDLTRKLHEAERIVPVDPNVVKKAVAKAEDNWNKQWRDRLLRISRSTTQTLGQINTAVAALYGKTRKVETINVFTPPPKPRPVEEMSLKEVKKIYPDVREEENAPVRGGERRMLEALCQFYPAGMSEGRLRALAKMRKSGTYGVYRGRLLKAGYAVIKDGEMFATREGIDFIGDSVPDTPNTTAEVVALWKGKLRGKVIEMLDVVVERNGDYISKEELFQAVGLRNSGTANVYLGDLKRAGLVVVTKEGVAADRENLLMAS